MKSILKLTALSLILFSCQKEITREDPNATPGTGSSGGSTSGTRLLKIRTITGSDTLFTSYSYNSSGRVTEVKLTGIANGQPTSETRTFVRNAENIITQLIQTGNVFATMGIDQQVTNYSYDYTLGRYKYAVMKSSFMGMVWNDSTVYSYDNSGRLAAINMFMDRSAGYMNSHRTEYTFTGNKVATEKTSVFDNQTNTFQDGFAQTYQYDSKTNPMFFLSDAVAMLSYSAMYSPNNIVNISFGAAAPVGPMSISYTYNSQGRPATGVVIQDGKTTNNTYYYQ
jgi:hypothetical protein